MLQTGAGTLKDTFNKKYIVKGNEDEASSNTKHGQYVKYPLSHKSKVDKGSHIQNLCDICETGNNATTSCVECKQYLCITCTLRHRNMRSSVSHHLVYQTGEYESKRSMELCLKHPKHEKLLLCVECSEEICILCNITKICPCNIQRF